MIVNKKINLTSIIKKKGHKICTHAQTLSFLAFQDNVCRWFSGSVLFQITKMH